MSLSGRFTSRIRVAQRSLRTRPTTLRLCANQTRSLLTVQTPSVTTAFRSSTISPSSNLLNSPVQFRAFTDKAAKATEGGEVGEENADEETAEPNKSEEAAEEAIKKKMEEEPYEFSEESKVEPPSETSENVETKSSETPENKETSSGEQIKETKLEEPESAFGGFVSGFKNMFGFQKKREMLPGESAEIAELQAKIKELEKQSNDFKNAALEYKAEVYNVRKRGQREVTNAQKYAVEKFAKEMLVIADNIDLAVKNVEKPSPEETHQSFITLYTSMEMTQKTIETVFKKFDLTKAESMGLKFDINIHEVLFQMPGEEGEEPGKIKNVVRDGYWLKDRALRSAQVGVVQV